MAGDAGTTDDASTGFAQAVNTGIHPAADPAAASPPATPAPASPTAADAARLDLLARLHAERTPIAARMNAAAGEAERRRIRDELHQVDERYLEQLAAYPAATRYQHTDEAIIASAEAALQLRAAYSAESRLGHSDQGRRDAEAGHLGGMRASGRGVTNGAEWCGAFANAQHHIDPDLGRAFMHTTNVEHFFRYQRDGRSPGWIRTDGVWSAVHDYHRNRHSERRWWGAEDVRALRVTPQAGDIVLIDHSHGGGAEHVAMVHSYDPASHRMTLIDGNGGGFVVDHRPTATPAAASGRRRRGRPAAPPAPDPDRDHASAAAGGQRLRRGGAGDVTMAVRDLDDEPTQAEVDADLERTRTNPDAHRRHARIYGIGRLSAVDYEEHDYASRDPGAATTTGNRGHTRAPRHR